MSNIWITNSIKRSWIRWLQILSFLAMLAFPICAIFTAANPGDEWYAYIILYSVFFILLILVLSLTYPRTGGILGLISTPVIFAWYLFLSSVFGIRTLGIWADYNLIFFECVFLVIGSLFSIQWGRIQKTSDKNINSDARLLFPSYIFSFLALILFVVAFYNLRTKSYGGDYYFVAQWLEYLFNIVPLLFGLGFNLVGILKRGTYRKLFIIGVSINILVIIGDVVELIRLGLLS